jgi:hypothetical protein
MLADSTRGTVPHVLFRGAAFNPNIATTTSYELYRLIFLQVSPSVEVFSQSMLWAFESSSTEEAHILNAIPPAVFQGLDQASAILDSPPYRRPCIQHKEF